MIRHPRHKRPVLPGGGYLSWTVFLVFLALEASPAEVIDQVAADVSGQAVTLSELRSLLTYRGFRLSQDLSQDRAIYLQILDQVIDQKLIAEQAQHTPGVFVSAEQIESQFTAYRARFASEDLFQQQLETMGMTAAALKELIRRELMVWKFVQVRFEPFIIVLPQQIQTYYEEQLVPRLSQSGGRVPPLDLVREQISEILTLEGTNRALERWINDFRTKTQVRILLFRDPPRAANLPTEFLGSGKDRQLKTR